MKGSILLEKQYRAQTGSLDFHPEYNPTETKPQKAKNNCCFIYVECVVQEERRYGAAVVVLLDDRLCHPNLPPPCVLCSWKEWGLLRQGLQHPIIPLF